MPRGRLDAIRGQAAILAGARRKLPLHPAGGERVLLKLFSLLGGQHPVELNFLREAGVQIANRRGHYEQIQPAHPDRR